MLSGRKIIFTQGKTVGKLKVHNVCKVHNVFKVHKVESS